MTLLTLLSGSNAGNPPFASLEFHDGTAWRDISADAMAGTLHWSGGLRGSGPTDRIATPGVLEVELDNSTGNSAKTLGYYSPDHASKRTGFVIGAKIRVTLFSGGNLKRWCYRIKEIRPIAGQYGSRRVEVQARDYMEEFSTRKTSGLAIQTNKRGDQLLATLVASMPFAPGATDYDTGAFYFPYAFHDEQDENTACLTVLQKIAQSELSYIYVDGDAAEGETLHYESHLTRFSSFSASGTLSDSMSSLTLIHSTDNIYNKIKATTYPIDVDTDLSVLGKIPQEFALEPGETKTIEIRYIDETTSRRISGAGLQTPVADTDYKMSSRSGDGGNGLNASLTVSPTAGANTMEVDVTNSAVVKGYVNLLQVRGYKVTLYDKVESVKNDATSITAYGERTITYNMPYQSQSTFGDAAATEILRRHKNPTSTISGVNFIANKNSTLMSYAITHGIGTRDTITETATGISSGFFINGFDYELLPGNVLSVTWILERAFNDTPYFTLNHVTYGVTNSIYKTAPF